MPVSVQICECCPVVIDWYLMLCHTQCHQSPTWSIQWPDTSKCVSAPSPLQVSNHSDKVQSLLALMCFLKERCESHQSPRNFVDSSTGRKVLPILITGGISTLDRGAVKSMTLHLWVGNLKPFLVTHSCIPFTACCKGLSMVSRERP